MKKFAALFLLLCLTFLTSCTNTEVPVIFNSTEYAKITKEQLFEKLGEPKRSDEWTNKTDKGDFKITNHTYNIDNLYVEFLTHEDIVVKVYIFPNEKVKFTNNHSYIFKQFGIDAKSNIQPYKNTGATLKFSDVSDIIQSFDIYDFDKSSKTYGYVYITYDSNYFN